MNDILNDCAEVRRWIYLTIKFSSSAKKKHKLGFGLVLCSFECGQ